ncbi:MAG: tRNA (adenosine(37)-N6)-dimethylallyltransferase MiaA [Ignavibacteriales bacterium]
MERKVIVITGPTCSGKTALSLKLAETLKTEIISADSRQVYKYLDIGTAKPSPDELTAVKHHFIDSLTPDQDFNVSKFEQDALNIIYALLGKGKIPIVSGGSGLYVKAVTDGIFNTADTDDDLRARFKSILDEQGREYLYEQLKKADPAAAETMLPQNWKRVMRALEVFHLTGRSILEHHGDYQRNIDVEFLQFGLNWDRAVLYRNIENRVDYMISHGLVDEARRVLEMGYGKDLNSLNTVGYKEIFAFLNKEITLERAVELIKRNTRRFAKRQMTWFRRDDRIRWFDIANPSDLDNIRDEILKFLQ